MVYAKSCKAGQPNNLKTIWSMKAKGLNNNIFYDTHVANLEKLRLLA
jgi:hypothetical protein